MQTTIPVIDATKSRKATWTRSRDGGWNVKIDSSYKRNTYLKVAVMKKNGGTSRVIVRVFWSNNNISLAEVVG